MNPESTPEVPPLPAAAPVVLVAAVELELAPLRPWLAAAAPATIGRKPATRARLDGLPVVLLACGMGKTNAAQALTALLEREPVRAVLNLGVGGAFPGAGLAVGDVALADAEIYADEGVETPAGWISTEEIGIPLLETAACRRFNAFPLDGARVERAARRLTEAGHAVRVGPFVTVSCCSGTARRGAELAARFGALCESMEGAALAHVCALYDVPFLELRGISNLVEDRDLSRWRLRAAAEAAARAARTALPAL